MNIEIPESVIKAEVDWSTANTIDEEYTVDVTVGGVVVMTRTFPKAYDGKHDFASSGEDAQNMALEEFGKALRSLIGEIKA